MGPLMGQGRTVRAMDGCASTCRHRYRREDHPHEHEVLEQEVHSVGVLAAQEVQPQEHGVLERALQLTQPQ